jgi:uncharacterized protein (TIGR02217 family)
MTAAFHEVRFPLDIARGARGGPERRTDVVTLASGREQRNARWALSRRRYDAGYGIKNAEALAAVVAFFEERRGRLHGFRWRDRADYTSTLPGQPLTPADQLIGMGNGTTAIFQLVKTYGSLHAPYARPVTKPVSGTVRIAVAGVEKTLGLHVDYDVTTGLVTFATGQLPPAGAAVTAGFAFDVPVRFDTDFLEIDWSAFDAGAIPKIPLVEIQS